MGVAEDIRPEERVERAPAAPQDVLRRLRWHRALATAAVAAVAVSGGAFANKVRVHERAQGRELGRAIEAGRAKDAVVDRLVDVLAAQGTLDPAVVSGSALRDLDELPGYERRTTSGQRQQLASATVRLGRRLDPSTPWERRCTGTVVEHDGRRLILSAAHCFLRDLVIDDVGYDEGGVDVRDLTRRAGAWAVLGPGADPAPLAMVRRVAASVRPDSDWALLSLEAPTDLDDHDAIDLRAQLVETGTPEPGEEVVLHAYPSAAGGEQVAARGRYVGRLAGGFGAFNQPTDLVAIDPASSAADACFYGASGSSAVFAGGMVSGPLSGRNTLGYGPGHTLEPPDELATYERLNAENVLRVHLLHAPAVLCGFSVVDPRVVQELLGRLDLPPLA